MREHFHVPDNYFLSHSVGCQPKATLSALKLYYLKPWISGKNWTQWMIELDKFRTGLGELLGVSGDLICPQTNISSALTKVIYSLPKPTKRKAIVLCRQDFPTVGFVFKQAERAGYEVKFIKGAPTDISNWKAAIDYETAIVHITHALSNTSHVLPVQQICDLTRQSKAISIVDIAQSFGAIPVDIKSWSPDFITGTGVKFLCFGPGACFLYCSKEKLSQSQPIDVGWFSHENPFEMDIGNFRYAKDAIRFFGGTPSPAPLVAANSAIEIWKEIGLDRVHQHIQKQLSLLVKAIDAKILMSPISEDLRSATLSVAPTNRERLREAARANKIFVTNVKKGFVSLYMDIHHIRKSSVY